MGLTRRGFLRGGAGIGAAVVSGGSVLAACADAVPGTPRAAARSAPPRLPGSSTRPPRRRAVRMAVPQGSPYAYQEGSEVTGQTVEVARAVLKNVGVPRVDFVLVTFDKLFVALASKQADMVGGIYVVDQNICRGMVFSAPDHIGLTALAVPPGNPKTLKTVADAIAARARIAVMRDLPEHKYLTTAGVPAGQVKVLPTPFEMLRAVTAGQADCAAFGDMALRSIIAAEGLKLEVTNGFVLDSKAPLAAAFAMSAKDELLTAFSTELRKLQDSGEWLRIAQPFGFTRENVPPPDLTADRLCAG